VKGKKPKLQAFWMQQNLDAGFSAWGMATLTRGLGWSKEKVEELLTEARKDLRDTRIHAYAEVYVVYGRKPLD